MLNSKGIHLRTLDTPPATTPPDDKSRAGKLWGCTSSSGIENTMTAKEYFLQLSVMEVIQFLVEKRKISTGKQQKQGGDIIIIIIIIHYLYT